MKALATGLVLQQLQQTQHYCTGLKHMSQDLTLRDFIHASAAK